MTKNLSVKSYSDRTFADVTFVFDGQEEKAHKCVLADRCEYFKQLFNQTNSNVINMNETSLKVFKELVKFCYLQKIEVSNWSYDDKKRLYELATSYKYGPLMDFVKRELNVTLSVNTLNEWHQNSPGEELREWIKRNIVNIVNYEDCHEYSKDLIIFILDTFNEMDDKERNKYKLLTVQKKLLLWLFRWRNWSNRDEEDVHCIFSKTRLSFVFNEWASWEIPIPMKLSQAVHDFMWLKEVKTDGWKRDEILKLLCWAHDYDFGPLFDAVLNIVTTQHLEPSSLAIIHGIAGKLESSKLQKLVVDYLRNNTMSVFTSANFTSYSARVVGFILDSLSGQVMDAQTMWLIFNSIQKWMNSNGKEEGKKVFMNIKRLEFIRKLLADFYIKLFKDDHSKDVTFVFDNQAIKAHKCVLNSCCKSFKQLFDQNTDNRIDMKGTRIESFYQMIEHCYLKQIDFTNWGFSEKKYLYDLATKYKYQSLMDLVQIELDKRPKIPINVESLNEWYEKCPDDEIREWVKINLLNIVNYEECHKYSKDLVVLIMDTFCELSNNETDKEKLETPLKKLLLWLFRWRTWFYRKEQDVHSLFPKIRLPLVFEHRAFGDKTLQKKFFEAVRRFCYMRRVDTSGWTGDDVLELLYFAHDYEFGPLLDALVNTVARQYLEPAFFPKIHDLASKLDFGKLRKVMVDYIKKHTMIILTSADFTNYPASLVGFIFENLSGQGMDVNVKNQLLTSLWKWKTSKSEKELKAVFDKTQWKDYSQEQLARVLHIMIPATCVAVTSGSPAPAEGKRVKRKQSSDFQCRRSVRLRKE